MEKMNRNVDQEMSPDSQSRFEKNYAMESCAT